MKNSFFFLCVLLGSLSTQSSNAELAKAHQGTSAPAPIIKNSDEAESEPAVKSVIPIPEARSMTCFVPKAFNRSDVMSGAILHKFTFDPDNFDLSESFSIEGGLANYEVKGKSMNKVDPTKSSANDTLLFFDRDTHNLQRRVRIRDITMNCADLISTKKFRDFEMLKEITQSFNTSKNYAASFANTKAQSQRVQAHNFFCCINKNNAKP